jgi:DeoR/GlpR family transcriptional regulator of sugar metabolism
MLAEERRQNILEMLERADSVSVTELCERFTVSDMTIRRDLDALAKRNLLQKVHGGAVRSFKAASEQPYQYKKNLQQVEKRAIARKALGLIRDGDTVAFSAGTTTWSIATMLQGSHRDLTFITNSTNIALTLQENGSEQILLSGGMFRTPSDALVGPYADRILRLLNADILFIGIHGLDADAGLTTPNVAEAETNLALVEGARRIVVVADHTKFGVVALAKIAPLSRVDTVITDEGTSKEIRQILEQNGIQVVIAETNAGD